MIGVERRGDRLFCGRGGCDAPIGEVMHEKRVRLIGHGWHQGDDERWRKASRLRGRDKASIRDQWGAYLPGGPRGYELGRAAIVECPRCKAVQTLDW